MLGPRSPLRGLPVCAASPSNKAYGDRLDPGKVLSDRTFGAGTYTQARMLTSMSLCFRDLFADKLHFSCIPLEQKSLHTQLLLLGNSYCNYTHISYTVLIVEELICVMRVYLWCLPVLPL